MIAVCRRLLVSCFVVALVGSIASAQGVASIEEVAQALDLMKKGRYGNAEKKLANLSDTMALRLRIELLARKGDRDAADRVANQLVNGYSQGRFNTPHDLAQAAYAAWHLDRWQDANQIFIEAAELGPAPTSMHVDWGNLYLEQYNAAEAESIFQDAVRATSGEAGVARWSVADAYLGLAQAFEAQGKPGASEAVEQAREADADSLDLLAYETLLLARESNWEEALKKIESGLEKNKNFVPLLEVQAAVNYFNTDAKAYQKIRDRLIEINSHNAELFELLGDMSVARRRLREAIQFYREAVERDPRSWSALASLGINLLRVGDEKNGTEVLERAYAADPFNIWTVNTLRLLDSFTRFDRFSTDYFDVKLERSEAQALWPYVGELLERSFSELSEKYGFEPQGRYVFEMFDSHDDFAVRTLGLPGLGALGATFGRVVAMDSPSSRADGKFHYGSTLWHEVAHVVTLGMSDQKVPRWFTEGLSMMEERLAGDGWGDFVSPAFVEAWEQEKLLPLTQLNSGFERPKFPGQLELSYFQAGWVCDFLASEYGFEKIRAMLRAYADGKSDLEVFTEVLEDPLEVVDEKFAAVMKAELEPLVPRLKAPGTVQLDSPELELATLRQAVETQPDNYVLRMQLSGHLIQAEEFAEATDHLEAAIEIFPYSAGPRSPYSILADIYRREENQDKLLELLLRWWKMAPRLGERGVEVAEMLIEVDRFEEAKRVLEGVMFVDPLKPSQHQLLGDLYLREEMTDRAVTEFRVLLALDPPDKANAHYSLAAALAQKGEPEEARKEVLLALEIAPTFSEAQQLLLKLVRQ